MSITEGVLSFQSCRGGHVWVLASATDASQLHPPRTLARDVPSPSCSQLLGNASHIFLHWCGLITAPPTPQMYVHIPIPRLWIRVLGLWLMILRRFSGWASRSNDMSFWARGEGDRHRGEGHVKTKSETGMMSLPATEHQELPEAGRCKIPPPRTSEDTRPAHTLLEGLLASRTGESSFCCWSHPV